MPRPLLLSCVLSCVLVVLAAGACSQRVGSAESVSGDDAVQLKYEAARRVLDDIKALKRAGSSTEADCATARLVFLKDLKRLQAPAAQRLVKELITICDEAPQP